jgi:hypothetical protein
MRTGAPVHVRLRSAPLPRAIPRDAIELLQADHHQLQRWFGEYHEAQAGPKRAELVRRICHALKVHLTVEEEIFHPSFLDATGEAAVHHEAKVEHVAARNLIQRIERGGVDDECFDANVMMLAEAINHHAHGEERRGGMLAEARRSGMDLKFIGRQMLARKNELDRAFQ